MKNKNSKIDINPNLVKWAREKMGLSIEEVAKKLKISVEQYKKLENGEERFTIGLIYKLTKILKRNFAFFFLSEIPKPLEKVILGNEFSEIEVKFVKEMINELLQIKLIKCVMITKKENEIWFVVITTAKKRIERLKLLLYDIENTYGNLYPSIIFHIRLTTI